MAFSFRDDPSEEVEHNQPVRLIVYNENGHILRREGESALYVPCLDPKEIQAQLGAVGLSLRSGAQPGLQFSQRRGLSAYALLGPAAWAGNWEALDWDAQHDMDLPYVLPDARIPPTETRLRLEDDKPYLVDFRTAVRRRVHRVGYDLDAVSVREAVSDVPPYTAWEINEALGRAGVRTQALDTEHTRAHRMLLALYRSLYIDRHGDASKRRLWMQSTDHLPGRYFRGRDIKYRTARTGSRWADAEESGFAAARTVQLVELYGTRYLQADLVIKPT